MDILIERDRRVAMRDGVELATDVYRPHTSGRYATLLARLPYDKDSVQLRNYSLDVLRAVRSHYAVVVQDTRGRYASDGQFRPFADEARDGADTLAWCAGQPWSTGEVGMFGGSYFGATQWLAAAESPPELRAIAPFLSGADPYDGWLYHGGAFALGFGLLWSLLTLGIGEAARRDAAAGTRAAVDAVLDAIDAVDTSYLTLPLTDQPVAVDVAPYYSDWLAHTTADEYWSQMSAAARFDRIAAPALIIGGWYDIFLGATLASYHGMKQRGATSVARRPRLVLGPWAHGNQTGAFPERNFGARAAISGFDLTGATLRWFDHRLKGAPDRTPAVSVFVMGSDVWRDEDDWPLPDTRFTRYYLHSDGAANGSAGTGSLTPLAPAVEPHDRYVCDPDDPVPTHGGATFLPGLGVSTNSGPRDQRVVEARSDVLCFTTTALERELELTGPVVLHLYASSSAVDVAFVAKLVDVHPDGRAMLLVDGILRGSFRDSLDTPSPMEPGRIYALRIDMRATANVFGAGHRIRLDIASSDFPRYARTGPGITVTNRIHHDDQHPSHLILPIIDRS